MTQPVEAEQHDEVVFCARHPKVETLLRCGRCGTPICPRCLVQTPVGARCRECANVRTLPTLDVKPTVFAKGIAGGFIGGAFAGAVWGFALPDNRVLLLGIFGLVLVAGVLGWAVSESVNAATNRRRGVALQACAVLGCVVAYLVHNAVSGNPLLLQGDTWGYLATAGAAFFGASRLKFW